MTGGEGFAAAAALRGVGIGNFETAAGQGLGEIHHGAADVIGAEGIHQDGYAEAGRGEIAVAFLVKSHAVLEAGTAALFDVNAKALAGAFGIGGEFGLNLVGGVFGEIHHGFCDIGHAIMSPELARGARGGGALNGELRMLNSEAVGEGADRHMRGRMCSPENGAFPGLISGGGDLVNLLLHGVVEGGHNILDPAINPYGFRPVLFFLAEGRRLDARLLDPVGIGNGRCWSLVCFKMSAANAWAWSN